MEVNKTNGKSDEAKEKKWDTLVHPEGRENCSLICEEIA
jgi:hypothetical protein